MLAGDTMTPPQSPGRGLERPVGKFLFIIVLYASKRVLSPHGRFDHWRAHAVHVACNKVGEIGILDTFLVFFSARDAAKHTNWEKFPWGLSGG